jgi:hypothetical protein
MDLSNEVTFKSTNKVSIDDHNFVIANYIDNSTSNLHDIISNDGQWSFVVQCVCDDKLQCSSNLTIPEHSCMAHQQMLATTAAKIIHTAVQVWLALCYILVIVMCQYGSIYCLRVCFSVQTVCEIWFLLETATQNFVVNFPGTQFQA